MINNLTYLSKKAINNTIINDNNVSAAAAAATSITDRYYILNLFGCCYKKSSSSSPPPPKRIATTAISSHNTKHTININDNDINNNSNLNAINNYNKEDEVGDDDDDNDKAGANENETLLNQPDIGTINNDIENFNSQSDSTSVNHQQSQVEGIEGEDEVNNDATKTEEHMISSSTLKQNEIESIGTCSSNIEPLICNKTTTNIDCNNNDFDEDINVDALIPSFLSNMRKEEKEIKESQLMDMSHLDDDPVRFYCNDMILSEIDNVNTHQKMKMKIKSEKSLISMSTLSSDNTTTSKSALNNTNTNNDENKASKNVASKMNWYDGRKKTQKKVGFFDMPQNTQLSLQDFVHQKVFMDMMKEKTKKPKKPSSQASMKKSAKGGSSKTKLGDDADDDDMYDRFENSLYYRYGLTSRFLPTTKPMTTTMSSSSSKSKLAASNSSTKNLKG